MTEAEKKFVVHLAGVQMNFGDGCVLDVPHLTFVSGERVFILGRSGSGKTTLARLIKGRLIPSKGSVLVLGEDPASSHRSRRRAIQRRIAMIDQEFYLVPRMSVIANILSGALGRVRALRSLVGWYPSAEWEKAEAILREVGLEGLGDRRVETLSGGQRQRAAIARALMQEADCILADEPISNLDPELAEDALELLVRCTERRDVTLIVNLHQPRLAKRFATRVIGLSDAKVVFDGPPEKLTSTGEEFIYQVSENDLRKAKTTEAKNDSTPATLAK